MRRLRRFCGGTGAKCAVRPACLLRKNYASKRRATSRAALSRTILSLESVWKRWRSCRAVARSAVTNRPIVRRSPIFWLDRRGRLDMVPVHAHRFCRNISSVSNH